MPPVQKERTGDRGSVRIISPLELTDHDRQGGAPDAWGNAAQQSNPSLITQFIKSRGANSYLSLRAIIIVSLLVSTATVGGLSWFLTYRSSEQSISKLSRDLQYGIQIRLLQSFDTRLSYAEDLVETNKKIIQSGLYNPLIYEDIISLMKIFWSEVRTSRSSSTATITTTKGELWGHFVYPGSMNYGIWETVDGTTTEYFSDYIGQKTNVSWSNPEPGNLRGTWYTVINPADKSRSTWTDMYIWENRFWITRSSGAYTENGTFIGVLCSDIELGFVDTIISDVKLNEEKNIDIFVVDQQNHLIGSSLKLDLIECHDQEKCSGQVFPRKIGDIDNPMTKVFLKYFQLNNKASSSKGEIDIIKIEGKDYMISLSSLERNGLSWKVCSLIPRSLFMSSIEKNKWITMAYVFSLIGGFEIVILFFSIYVTRPLKEIALAMMQISQLNFSSGNKKDEKDSAIREVALIQSSFRRMNVALQTFGKFVPMSVVRRIMKNITIAHDLYVERKTLTIMFSDLKGFTSLAESLPIDTLLCVLSEYLDMMSTLIAESDGILCDFIGDGIMSFWNSPIPVANHECVAINTALRQAQALHDLNRYWISQGYLREPLEMRIGIHTGEVLVGNIGSQNRMKYGAVGDAVNLASRLEGLNKRYETKIIISDTTFEKVKDVFISRPLETVVVKGRSAPLKIYEVLASSNENMNAARRQELEKKKRILDSVEDLHFKPTQMRDSLVNQLRDYVNYNDDKTAHRILEIIETPSFNGVSILDEK